MKYELMNQAASILEKNDFVEISSPPKTDFFIDMCSEYKKANAPFYYSVLNSDFILRCQVRPELKFTYDAGCLFIFESETKWIKFAFENTDLLYPSLVSVVTNDISDDCNGEQITEPEIWMQIVRKGQNWCLHYSNDKENWKMVRYFRLVMNKTIKVGVSSQSPIGEGCKVIFKNIEVLKNEYSDIRKAK